MFASLGFMYGIEPMPERTLLAFQTATRQIQGITTPPYMTWGIDRDLTSTYICKEYYQYLKKVLRGTLWWFDQTKIPYTMFTSAEMYYWYHVLQLSNTHYCQLVDIITAVDLVFEDMIRLEKEAQIGILGSIRTCQLFHDNATTKQLQRKPGRNYVIPGESFARTAADAFYYPEETNDEALFDACQSAVSRLINQGVAAILVADFEIERWLKQQTLGDQLVDLTQESKVYWKAETEQQPIYFISAQQALLQYAVHLCRSNPFLDPN